MNMNWVLIFHYLMAQWGYKTTIYNAINNDVIYNVDVTPSTGADEMTANGASIGNKGIEFTIDYRAIDTEKLKWTQS
ncbi:hypothetical protein CM15mP94_3110 [bacterium]|nr:MAG: hypothetical protein CM15mP94_3110 [bacterium]